ncbi:TonB-dependent receptor [Paraburkholderia solisilvae]|uniref:Ferrichrome receptor FcuA n=1 Tax=Paraburkholderia solisilvae TaxID=624376 RepID=A0A6J5D5Z5_9BURK|nr:TonB-dependent siderophore receptor [Paraburkholderia solisilvae]CAB3748006.1 Ferrichrome receptor FcuA [Paraburkholderia solisilvae]
MTSIATFRPRLRPLQVAVRRAFLRASLPFALSLCGIAHAQSDAPPPPAGTDKTLPTVKVEGAATPLPGDFAPTYSGGEIARGGQFGLLGNQKLSDVPFSMTSYTSKAIENSQAHSIGELLAHDPDVRPAYGFGNFSEVFVIRGFQLNGDDISLNGLYGVTPRQLVAPEVLERVDVFKGANAFLDGASPTGSAIGGGINLELKRADDKPLTRVTAEASGSGQVGTHVDVGRRFGSDGQFGIRVNGAIRGGETSIDDEFRHDTSTAVSLDYRGDKLRLYGDFLYQRRNIDEGRSTVQVTGTDVPDPPSATHNFAQPWTQSTLEDTVGILRAEYDFLPGWTAYASGGTHHAHEDGTYSSPTFDSVTGTTATASDILRTTDAQSATAGVRGHFATGPVTHRVAAGFAITSIEDREAFAFSSAFPTSLYGGGAVPMPPLTSFVAGNFADPGLADQILMRSVAVSDTLGILNDRVLFTIGARHQQLHQNNFTVGTDSISSSFDQSINTPIFGLVVKATNSISLFANRAESLAPGQTAPIGAANVGQTLAPNRTKQYEVGAKYDSNHFGGTLSLFQIEQPTAFTDPTTNLFGTNGTQRHRGIELSVYGEVAKGVRLLAGATLLNAKQLDTAGGATDGDRPIGVPSYLFNVSGEYDLPWVPGLTLDAAWIHTGNQFLDAANKLSIPAWDRFDLGARYTLNIYKHPTTFRATVENVTNKAYWASATGAYLTQGRPRTFLMSVTTDF